MKETKTISIGEYSVKQRTIDGYFDLNTLIKSLNELEGKKTKYKKVISTFKFKKAKVIIRESYKVIPLYIIKGTTQSNGVKIKDQVWTHPYLFIYACLELGSRLKYKTLSNLNFISFLKEFTLEEDNEHLKDFTDMSFSKLEELKMNDNLVILNQYSENGNDICFRATKGDSEDYRLVVHYKNFNEENESIFYGEQIQRLKQILNTFF